MSAKTLTFRRDNLFVEQLVSSKLFWVIFLVLGFAYPIYRSVNRELPPELPVLVEVPEFRFTNEFGRPFGSQELKGRAYIASFIFTSCPTTCPAIMEKTQLIQKRVRGLGTKVALVSFTVDPEFDTPAVLNKYARGLSANPHVWTFLTTENKEEMRELLVDGFRVPMGDLEEFEAVVDGHKVSLWDIAHTERMVLVDNEGNVRGYYSTTTDDINKMMIDVGLLVNRRYEF
jgi:protein SCO1